MDVVDEPKIPGDLEELKPCDVCKKFCRCCFFITSWAYKRYGARARYIGLICQECYMKHHGMELDILVHEV